MRAAAFALTLSLQVLALCLGGRPLYANPKSPQTFPCNDGQVFVRALLESTEAKFSLKRLDSDAIPADRALAAPFSSSLLQAHVAWIDENKHLQLSRLSGEGIARYESKDALALTCDAECRLFNYDVDDDGEEDVLIQDPASDFLFVVYLKRTSVREVKNFGPLEGQVIGAMPGEDKGSHSVAALLPKENYALEVRALAPGLPLGSRPALDHFAMNSKLIRVGLRGEYYLSTKLPGLRPWFLIGVTGWGGLAHGPEFPGPGFDWFGNHVWADINGDGRTDVVSKAIESREIWAGYNTSFYNFPALLELPIHTDTAVPMQTQLKLAGDFDGDGDEDILLYDRETASHYFAFSLMTLPLSNEPFVTSGGVNHRSNAEGFFCAELEAESGPIAHLTREYSMERYVELYRGVWNVLLKRTDSLPGAAFSLGRRSAPPYVCTSYVPSIFHDVFLPPPSKWGQRIWQSCDYPQAIFFVDDVFPASEFSAASLPSITCCPLPTHDIFDNLNPDMRLLPDRCPDGHIAKGVVAEDSKAFPPIPLLRCVAIDDSRFQLGPTTGGVYWGAGFTAINAEPKLRKDQLPMALRYAVERNSRQIAPSGDGCVGSPPGSVLVGFGDAEGCAGYLFREVQYAGAAGDPPKGTPVQMFPDCADVVDIHSPFAYCKPKVDK